MNWWEKWAGAIAFGAVIVVCIFLFWKVESALDELRAGNIEGCNQANEARAAERTSARANIVRTRTSNLSILFPNTDPMYLDRLKTQSIQDELKTIEVNRDVDCEARYPDSSVFSYITQ